MFIDFPSQVCFISSEKCKILTCAICIQNGGNFYEINGRRRLKLGQTIVNKTKIICNCDAQIVYKKHELLHLFALWKNKRLSKYVSVYIMYCRTALYVCASPGEGYPIVPLVYYHDVAYYAISLVRNSKLIIKKLFSHTTLTINFMEKDNK